MERKKERGVVYFYGNYGSGKSQKIKFGYIFRKVDEYVSNFKYDVLQK